ncbi:competence protein ComEC [Paractinoplanes abujensis]|uniref:Competence protein ComEC n=1 Tax=Paractinoplanes abujensis TaxID=882441 RepID=A0A7W7G3D0_9ACTN|nr:ComEC/Rec2 family competence protein [Actinoplanes abujensis]MBB4694747.1 competence protein ComEC [Actinoplanes abujensis]GID20041.1 competence protein ComEC [Actinoplanes abujensis]
MSALAALYLTARAGILIGVGAAALAIALTVAIKRAAAGGADHQRQAPPRAAPCRSGTGRKSDDAGGSRAGWAHAGRWVGPALLLGVACGAVTTGARVSVREAGPLVEVIRAGDPVWMELIVRDDPRALRSSAGMPPTYIVAVDLQAVRPEHGATLRLSARALVLGSDPAWRGLLPGQRVRAEGKLMPPRGGDLRAAVASVRKAPQVVGRPSWAQRAAGALRAGLQRACEPLPDRPGGLLPGLIVGDTSRLDPALEEDFRATGMTHLNAVSGANVAIVLGVVLFAVRRTRAGPVITALVCAAALVGFVILARPSPSVVRAAAMGAIGLIGLASGRRRAALPALAAGVAVLILADPELASDVGFALSVLATSGLLLLAPVWRDGLRARGWPPGPAEALAVPAAAQVVCGPVVAGLSGAISIVAVPANLLAVPAIAPATLLGVTAAVISPVWPAGAEFAAWLGHWPAQWLVLVATYGARVPAGALPWPGGLTGALLLAVITVGLLVATRRPLVRKLVTVVTLGGVLGALPVRLLASGWPPPGWLVVACAVGQGDAIVLPAGSGRAVVVDAGPEPNAVDHCLRRLGVRQVVLFVVSHFHVDHIGGVTGVFRGRDVRAVVGPSWPDPPAGRAAVRAAAGRVAVHAVGPGWAYEAGNVRLRVLGPVEPMRGTNSDPNNNSLVLRAEVDGRTILLPGDAETEEQEDMLTHLGVGAVRADVLKVAHHGSSYQSARFLDEIRPSVALVSVGADNDYGHPNGPLLARLARGGARVLRTDQLGDLAAVASGRGLAVVARGDPPAP